MATSPLYRLPPELLCKILVDLGDISDVIHLARASRSFHRMWRANAKFVCSAIMPRSILCFPDAELLLSVQRARTGTEAQKSSIEGTPEAAMINAQRLCKNAPVVVLACKFFEADTHTRLPEGEMWRNPGAEREAGTIHQMSESERVRFHHAFYGLWQLSLSPIPVIRNILLAATDLRELLRLVNIGPHWVQIQASDEQLAQLDVFKDRSQPLFGILMETFHEKEERLLEHPGVAIPIGSPLGLFAVFDQYQHHYVSRMPEII